MSGGQWLHIIGAALALLAAGCRFARLWMTAHERRAGRTVTVQPTRRRR